MYKHILFNLFMACALRNPKVQWKQALRKGQGGHGIIEDCKYTQHILPFKALTELQSNLKLLFTNRARVYEFFLFADEAYSW